MLLQDLQGVFYLRIFELVSNAIQFDQNNLYTPNHQNGKKLKV